MSKICTWVNAMTNLEMALVYADTFEWSVFPCKHWGADVKKPKTMNGFKDATKDPEQIKKWWTDHPKSLIGIATGKVSGFWVVDVDMKNGKDGKKALRDKYGDQLGIKTLTQSTPTGGGHLLFNYDEEHPVGCGTNLLEGIDIRGDGGYIIVPPSGYHVDDVWHTYEWKEGTDFIMADTPDWAYHLAGTVGKKSTVPFDLNSTLSGLSQGSRDEEINKLAWMLSGKKVHYDIAKLVMAYVAGNCSPPFDETETLEKLDRAYSTKNTPVKKKDFMTELINKIK